MEQRADRLYQSAPLEKIDVEQRLEKKLKDVNNFNNSINKNKEMFTHFKDKNHKSKNKIKKYKTLSTILKSIDIIVIIATKSSSITSSLSGFGLIVIPMSSSIACGLTISKKSIYKMVKQNYIKYKKHMKKIIKQLYLSIN